MRWGYVLDFSHISLILVFPVIILLHIFSYFVIFPSKVMCIIHADFDESLFFFYKVMCKIMLILILMENIVGITQNVLEIWLIAQKNAVKNNADFDIEHDDGKYGLNYPKYAQNLVNWLKKC